MEIKFGSIIAILLGCFLLKVIYETTIINQEASSAANRTPASLNQDYVLPDKPLREHSSLPNP